MVPPAAGERRPPRAGAFPLPAVKQ